MTDREGRSAPDAYGEHAGRGLLGQFADVLREMPRALPELLTPRWVAVSIAEQQRCRQHGEAVGLRSEQIDEVMEAVQKYNSRHYATLPEEFVRERMTAYALGDEWKF